MTDSSAPATSAQGWIPVDTASQWYQMRGDPASLLLRGKGTCNLNAALCSFIGEVAAKRGLQSPTPWGFVFARDPGTLNPVLLPIDKTDPHGAPITWHNGGRRATTHLGKALMAMGLALTPAHGGGMHIPVEVVKDPQSGAPGLMLRVERSSSHTVKRRGSHALASAERHLAKLQAEVSRLQAAASQAGAK